MKHQTLSMSGSSTFRNGQRRVSSPLRDNTGGNGGSPSQEDPGDEKDEEIARLKRAYHDAVMQNSKKNASSKTNT
jgi:hypothetical protein